MEPYGREYESVPLTRDSLVTMDVLQLLMTIRRRPNEPIVRDTVRLRKLEVMELIRRPDVEALLQRETSESEWAASLYEALGEENQPSPEEQAIREQYLHALDDDEAQVGRAFSELLGTLPENAPVARLEGWFRGLDRVRGDEYRWLMGRPDVVAAVDGGSDSGIELLASRGIRPLTVLHAVQAVEGLVDPVMRPGFIREGDDIWFAVDEQTREITSAPLALDLVIGEIEDVCDTTEEVAGAILGWLIALAEYVPTLFNGCEADSRNGRVYVRYTGEFIENLFVQWSTAVPEN